MRDDRFQFAQARRDVRCRRLRHRAGLLARDVEYRLEQRGDALAHVRDGRDDGCAEPLAERLYVDEQPAFARFVDTVQGDDQRPAELAEFQTEFEILLERRCVDHLHEHVRRREVRAAGRCLVLRDARPLVAPEQVHEHDLVVLAQMMQRVDGWQIDERNLIEADVDHAFLIGAADARQFFVTRDRAGRAFEDRALSGTKTSDQSNAWATFAAQQRSAQRNGCFRKQTLVLSWHRRRILAGDRGRGAAMGRRAPSG